MSFNGTGSNIDRVLIPAIFTATVLFFLAFFTFRFWALPFGQAPRYGLDLHQKNNDMWNLESMIQDWDSILKESKSELKSPFSNDTFRFGSFKRVNEDWINNEFVMDAFSHILEDFPRDPYEDDEKEYCCAAKGKVILILCAGGDGRITSTTAELRSILEDPKDLMNQLSGLTYSPTNGSESSGDWFNIVTPK